MKKSILIALCTMILAVSSFAQSTSIEYKKVTAADSFRIKEKWIKSILTDTSLMGATSRDIASADAIIKYFANRFAYAVKYTDTASLLSAYAKFSHVVKYADTASILSNRLKITDTANMIARLVRKSDTATMLGSLVRKSDTASMLSGYARTGNISSGIISLAATGGLSITGTSPGSSFTASFGPTITPTNISASGGVTVSGSTSLASVSVTNLNASGNLTVSGTAALSTLTTTNVIVNGAFTGTTGNFSGVFRIGGNVFITGPNVGIGTNSPNGITANRSVLDLNGTSSVLYALSTGGTLRGFIRHDGTDMDISAVANNLKFLTGGGSTALTLASNQAATFTSSVGATTYNATNSVAYTTANMGTNASYSQWQNTGGIFYVGLDNSTASSFGNGNYGANIYNGANSNLTFWTNSTKALTIANNQVSTFTGAVGAPYYVASNASGSAAYIRTSTSNGDVYWGKNGSSSGGLAPSALANAGVWNVEGANSAQVFTNGSVAVTFGSNQDATFGGKIIKNGGTSDQFLKADGSTSLSTSVVASNKITGQTTTQTITSYSVVSDGLFIVGGASINTSGSGAINLEILYTNLNNVSGSTSVGTGSPEVIGTTACIQAKGGTTITLRAFISSGTPTYTATGFIQKL